METPYNGTESFLQEAEELLGQIEQSALSLASGDQSEDITNQLFRAFHTIKGSGAMFGFDAVAGFTHHVENLLDKVRGRIVPVTPQLTDLVLKAKDRIKMLLTDGNLADGPDQASGDALIAEIERLSGGDVAACACAPVSPTEASDAGVGPTWLIQFRPNPALFTYGGNPIALMRELRRLGQCEVMGHAENVPCLNDLEPDSCYFHWTIKLCTTASENTIRDIFIFVEEGADLKIERFGPAEESAAVKPSQTASTEAATRHKTISHEATVRVPAERLDRLVNLVGEFVMNQSRLAQAVSQCGAPEFANPVQELDRLVGELRDNVLGIRMLPIGTLFGRFQRLVHDLSKELQKEVELVTQGAETELDKSILDQLGEPLVHCLRNCLDHGIEPPAERLAKDKPARAAIRLSAVHTGSNVVVSIEDDGRGIDRAAVRAKATERRMILPDAILTDRDIFNLILTPGFSTAQKVTSISGRGVGMDAVKRQIEMLRGSISIASEEGKGTCVSIALPLTLAIIEGLLVQVNKNRFIIPMSAVQENVELTGTDRGRNNGRNVIAVRGELVPYIDLRSTFRLNGNTPPIEKVVIVQHEGERVGVVVDRVVGSHQTVIQSLGRFFHSVKVASGATIMGDGEVALILDIACMVRFANQLCHPAPLLAVAGGQSIELDSKRELSL